MAAEVALAAEGALDLAILRRLCAEAGLAPGDAYWGDARRTGKQGMTKQMRGWAAAASHGRPFLVLRDLDRDAPCAGALRAGLLPNPPPLMVLRIAVRAAEAWLIADREALAALLSVRPGALPAEPDACDDPKAALVAAAARSRSRAVLTGIAPRPGAGRPVGPDYTAEMIRFVSRSWSPARAEAHSPSLARARRRIGELAARLHRRSR